MLVLSDPQRQRMETLVHQGSEIPQRAANPVPVSLTQNSQKDSKAARPGSDNTAPPKNAPGRTSGTAGGHVTRSGRIVTPTQRLDL